MQFILRWSLDLREARPIIADMKIFSKIAVVAALLLGGIARGQGGGATLEMDALTAAQDFADEVRRGNLAITAEKMYPRWKARLCARIGGERVLLAEIEATRRQMKAQNIEIESYQAQPGRQAIGVRPGKKLEMVDGVQKEVLTTTEWLVFVPTVAVWRVVDPNTGKLKRVERKSFQVAVRPKAGGEWTFIDGAQLGLSDLRGLFPGLPETILFPERSGREL